MPRGRSGCTAGRQSWKCHSEAKARGHLPWGQREGETAGFNLHRAEPRQEKSSLAGLGQRPGLGWVERGWLVWAEKSTWTEG